MKRIDRASIVLAMLFVFAVALVGKAAYEQLYRHDYWTKLGQQQHYASSDIPAPRGTIYDEAGNVLVESRLMTKVEIAPHEVRSYDRLKELLEQVNVSRKFVERSLDTTRRWVIIPGLFLPNDVSELGKLRGVYLSSVMERVYATSAGIRRIVGLHKNGKAIDGIELALDDVLEGASGHRRVALAPRGTRFGSSENHENPEPGANVTLTLNRGLQDICERALSDAVDSLGASGGDIVVMNPHTGAVLALASSRDGNTFGNTAITEPYEPGSTLKPFMAAALIERGLATPSDSIDTYNGVFTINGRTIHDTHGRDWMSLFDVIKYSSNVGIVRFATRLTPSQKYEVLRDAGFGTPTGIALPGESKGIFYPPTRWSRQTPASVAMGYEIAVTPLQLATAYAAIANGGELLEPQIIKEIRGYDGQLIYATKRRVIRRIMSEGTASDVLSMMREVVEGGTSRRVELATIDVAGKSGTARRTIDGRYERGAYTASFVGLFPSDNPQYVVLAKLDNPKASIYGGVAAGSVTNVVLRAALAARDAALDLHQLTSSIHEPRKDTSRAARRADSLKAVREARAAAQRARAESLRIASGEVEPEPVTPAERDPRTGASYVISLPLEVDVAPPVATVRPVPDLRGLTVRQAVRQLHAAGFQVQIQNDTAASSKDSELRTDPEIGTPWTPGKAVKLLIPPGAR